MRMQALYTTAAERLFSSEARLFLRLTLLYEAG
jgi:hypothetical protein